LAQDRIQGSSSATLGGDRPGVTVPDRGDLLSASKIVVTGAGGFIGGHLVQRLVAECDASVTAVDIKPIHEWFQRDPRVDNISLDLRDLEACRAVMAGASMVYNLAADMGGMGFIERHKALCMLSVLINSHSLMAAREAGVRRYFYASSACVYNTSKQASPGNPGLALEPDEKRRGGFPTKGLRSDELRHQIPELCSSPENWLGNSRPVFRAPESEQRRVETPRPKLCSFN